MDPTTASVLNLLNTAGPVFDPNLPARLANAQAEVANVASNLVSAGLGDLSSLLSGFDPGDAMSQLGSFVDSELPNVFTNMSIFTSIINFDEAATLADAFSAFFTARGFTSAIDDINNTLVDPSSDGNTISDLDTAQQQAEALDNITDRVNQIVGLPTEALASVTAQTTFYANAATTLSNYALAQQIVGTFSDFQMKAVMGSVCSDELLDILNPNSPTQPPAQPPPAPPAPTGPDPTPPPP